MDEERIVQYFNNKYYNNQESKPAKAKVAGSMENIIAPYVIEVKVERYIPTDMNEPQLDLVKTITVDIMYKIGNEQRNVTMSKVKSRETPLVADVLL